MRISAVIVTHDRKDDLRRSIGAYLKQTHPDTEIVVVDNASTDGTREMMENDFPDVKYLWLPDNFDIRAINIGVEMSTGDVIWRNDNDSNPETDDVFEKVNDIMEKHPDIHILAGEDIEVRSNYAIYEWYPKKVDKENVPEKGYKSHTLCGTGAAIRREVFDKIGGFWEFGFEEIEFCTRAIVADFNIRYFPNIRTLHYASPGNRNVGNRFVHMSKQYVRYTWKFFPFWRAAGRTIVFAFMQFLQAIGSRVPISSFFEAIFQAQATIIHTIRNERRVVPKDKLEDITLGVNYLTTQIQYIGFMIRKKLKKWRKK